MWTILWVVQKPRPAVWSLDERHWNAILIIHRGRRRPKDLRLGSSSSQRTGCAVHLPSSMIFGKHKKTKQKQKQVRLRRVRVQSSKAHPVSGDTSGSGHRPPAADMQLPLPPTAHDVTTSSAPNDRLNGKIKSQEEKPKSKQTAASYLLQRHVFMRKSSVHTWQQKHP